MRELVGADSSWAGRDVMVMWSRELHKPSAQIRTRPTDSSDPTDPRTRAAWDMDTHAYAHTHDTLSVHTVLLPLNMQNTRWVYMEEIFRFARAANVAAVLQTFYVFWHTWEGKWLKILIVR